MKTVLGVMFCVSLAAIIMSPKPLIEVNLVYNNYSKDKTGEE